MRSTRLRKQFAAFSTGGCLLGITGVFSQIDFGTILVTLLSTFLQIVISAVFGTDVSTQILAGLFG